MQLIDTHTHLYSKQFDGDRQAMVQRALEAGVTKMFLPNVDRNSIAAMLELEAAFPKHCFAMMGLHPGSVNADYKEELAIVREWLDRRSFAGVGEIGIDLYWDKTFVKEQQDAFLTQCEWAKALNIPIVIHSRDAMDMTIDLVREVKDERLRGIFHCFTGTVEQAERIMELDFYLGIGGVLTYPKGGLDQVMAAITLDYVVLETDAPYLPPVPYRGKRNESAYITFVAEKLAAIKGMAVDQIAELTTANAQEIFMQKALV
ncbi:MAG: TatD family hydrolase [Saprospiraceae bacterium]